MSSSRSKPTGAIVLGAAARATSLAAGVWIEDCWSDELIWARPGGGFSEGGGLPVRGPECSTRSAVSKRASGLRRRASASRLAASDAPSSCSRTDGRESPDGAGAAASSATFSSSGQSLWIVNGQSFGIVAVPRACFMVTPLQGVAFAVFSLVFSTEVPVSHADGSASPSSANPSPCPPTAFSSTKT